MQQSKTRENSNWITPLQCESFGVVVCYKNKYSKFENSFEVNISVIKKFIVTKRKDSSSSLVLLF